MHVVFLPGETDDRQWWVIWLRAVVEGRTITCGISYQALRDHFEADLGAPLCAFRAHRCAVEQCMAHFIAQQGRVMQEDILVMRTQDVREVLH